MSDSQEWSDVMAMALALRSDYDLPRYESTLLKYCVSVDGQVAVEVGLVTAMVTLLSSLVEATAEHLEMTPDELAQFLLMEKFKRDLFGG